MRIFVNNVDSIVGNALCADLRRIAGVQNKILGTVKGSGDGQVPPSVKRLVSRAVPKTYLQTIQSCSLVIYDLHDCDLEDLEFVIKGMKLAELDHEVTFILVSSVSVWANTRREYEPKPKEETEEAEGGGEGEGEEEKPKEPEEQQPVMMKDSDYVRRIPPVKYQEWKTMETLVLSLNVKENIKTHVIGAGILYGNGEEAFTELFKAAWLSRQSHRIVSPGGNFIPTIHVRDVARLVKHLASTKVDQDYLLAVDLGNLTQKEIVQGIIDKVSNGYQVPLVAPEYCVLAEFADVLALDLRLEPSGPMMDPSFSWWCKEGLVANLEKVANEFCKWRNLRPIKVVVMGPPGSKVQEFSAKIANHYFVPVLKFDSMIDEAAAQETEFGAMLKEHIAEVGGNHANLDQKLVAKALQFKLGSNVCKYRGYVLENYPGSFAEAERLFMKRPDGAEEDEGEGGEGEEEVVLELNTALCPEFVVVLESAEDKCKERCLAEDAATGITEDQFNAGMSKYKKENLAEDGSPATADFFTEKANNGIEALKVNVDENDDGEVFQTIRVYMERKGRPFNYLKTEREIAMGLDNKARESEDAMDDAKAKERSDLEAKEEEERRKRKQAEEQKLAEIAENEAQLLGARSVPLRQYLLNYVVPTVSDGLTEICRVMPEDPVDYLAEYLFAHAHDIDTREALN